MDFDDLDDEIERRVADGEEVACGVKENMQPRQGTELPLMTRSKLLPSYSNLPARAQQLVPPYNGQRPIERKPVLRLLMIHGAGDNYEQDWYLTQEQAPPDIEVAMYEFPGHGHRKDEPFMSTLQELADECFEAFKDAMFTGTFALFGHSIGALIAILVSKRARAELGVEPVLVIMMERGSANYPLFKEKGIQILRDDPVQFFKCWNPQVWLIYDKLGEKGRRTLDMWQIDQLIDQEALEIGTHMFRCPILALQASHSIRNIENMEDMTPDERWLRDWLAEVGMYKEVLPDGRFFHGHFPAWTYDDWSKWTEHSQGCRVVECPDTSHSSIKGDAAMRSHVWAALRSIIDEF